MSATSVFTIVLSALLVLLLIARPLLHSAAKGLPWMGSLFSGDVAGKPPLDFSDFISITGFILTVIGIVVGWQSIKLENTRTGLENQIRDIGESNAGLEQSLRDAEGHGDAAFAPNVDIHLELPGRDSVLTGVDTPQFQWRYSRHSDRADYLVQVVRLDFRNPQKGDSDSNPEPVVSTTCDFDMHPTCTFVATKPAAQRSGIPPGSGTMTGRFLWRVVSVPDSGNLKGGQLPEWSEYGQLSEWSEYGSFEIYPDLVTRLRNDTLHRGGVIVGTTYSDNDHFSKIDDSGMPAGHDIDLIRLLIEGCLSLKKNAPGKDAVVYDQPRCIDAAARYAGHGKESLAPRPGPEGTSVYIRDFPSVEAGLAAIRRKEIDVFVGAVTRAKEREQEGLRFSDGYYPLHSVLYIHGQESQRVEDWARTPRSIGVIANSTNHWLATALSGESSFGGRLTIVAFPSYWALRNAFETRDIDGLLIDSVLGNELEQTNDAGGTLHRQLTGLEQTRAWHDYHDWLGYDNEEFAIAVASDQLPRRNCWDRFVEFFYLPHYGQSTSGVQDLYNPLQAALQSNEIQFILPAIKKNNVDLPGEPE